MIFLILVAALLFTSGFFSGSETGIYSVSRVKLAFRCRQGELRARILERLRSPVGPTIITILIGNNIVAEMLARLSERQFAFLGNWSVLATTVILTPLLLIFGEFLPKQFFRTGADRLMYRIVYVLFAVRILLAIPVWLAAGFTRLFQLMIPGPTPEVWEPHTSRPNLRTFFRTQAQGEHLSPTQRDMLDRIFVLERVTLAYEKVSRPIPAIAGFDASLSAGEVRARLGPKYFQRYLVMRDGSPIGYVSAVTLVTADADRNLGRLAQELPVMPLETPLHVALQRLHAAGADLALCTDRAGRPVRIAFRNDAVKVLAKMDD